MGEKMNHKVFRTIDDQVCYLKANKAVKVDDMDLMRNMLLDNNYYNLISCGKIKFARHSENGVHEYDESDFVEWIDYFEKDQEMSKHLIRNVLDFERKINSRVAYYIGELMETGLLTEREQEAIKHLIQSSRNVDGINFKLYSQCETWKYVTKMMFSDMKKLVFWLLENKYDFYVKIVKGYPFLEVNDVGKSSRFNRVRGRLNEINNLRNKLFHFTPLSIYLVYAKDSRGRLNNGEKRTIVKWVYRLSGNQSRFSELNEICNYSQKFVKMKKKPTINVD